MEWNPTRFFHDNAAPSTPFALLILNQPINERTFEVLRKHACFVICADGGANRYYDMMQAHGKESTDLPNTIVGDLDSIRPSVRRHYEGLGVHIIEDPDQYSTDFTKCLKHLQTHASEIVSLAGYSSHGQNGPSSQSQCLEILILGGLGGRVDQAFSQIHHLYAVTMSMKKQADHGHEPSNPTEEVATTGDLYLVSEESITFILQPGRNIIHTPGTNRPVNETDHVRSGTASPGKTHAYENDQQRHYLEENVGIIPLSGPARITTRGFEWDVNDWPTEIGGQISTSNHIRADVVEVEATVPVLFTAELAVRFKVGGKAR